MSTETLLRDRMTAFADSLTPAGPDLTGAARTARLQRRRRTAGTAAVAALAVAVVGVGVAGLATGAHHGTAPATGATAPPSPLPGLPEIAAIGIPAGMQVQDASTQGGQVWALVSVPGNETHEVLVHGTVGGELTRVPGSARTPLYADSRVLVSGPRAFLVTSVGDSAADPVSSSLATYDSRTGGLLRRRSFGAGTSAAIVDVAGGPAPGHALVVVGPVRDGAVDLQVSRISAAGEVGGARTVSVPASDWEALGGAVPEASAVTLVHADAGVLRYAYLLDGYDAVPRVDLSSGAVGQVDIARTSQKGIVGGAVGEVGARVLYAAPGGLFAGPPDSVDPSRVGFAGESPTVVDGRAYFFRQPLGETEQELDPVTLQPTGPILTTRKGQGPVLFLDEGQIATSDGADVHGGGGTLFFYGADVG